MRDFQHPGRSMVHGTRGMAATSHPLATATAIEVLRAGGNAVDAAIAACAVQGVVEPQSTGIGGDCFALYAPGGRVPPYAINGSGPAPAAASVDWFREQGIDAIGFESAHAVTVPGAVGTWERLLADHGTKGLDEVLQPAIRYAEEGFVVHSRVAHDWANAADDKLHACENARAIYLPGGRPPAAGDLHRLPALAETLRLIAKEGAAAFYKGAIADDIVAHLAAHGSLMTADDLAAFAPQAVEPISANYRGYDIYECPPNGQGIIALLILNMLEGFELAGLDPVGAERLHLEAEASRLGYRDRAALIADPDAVGVPVDALLSTQYADAMRRHIDPARAMPPELPPGYPAHGDTVYLTVVDGEGNAISFINSLFASFGTGLCTPSGVLLQNRGASFVIDEDHPNRIAGGKRPMHTIIPGMVGQGEHAVMPFGVMGGHFQACGHAHFLTNVIDYGMDPQAALDCPRAFHFGGVMALETTIAERPPGASPPSATTSPGRRCPTAAVRRSRSTARPACSPAAPTPARTAAPWGFERRGRTCVRPETRDLVSWFN